MAWRGWEKYTPGEQVAPEPAAPVSTPAKRAKLDRGRGQRGAKWSWITPEGDLIDYAQQRELHQHEWDKFTKETKRKGWILIQSRKEARRYVGLLSLEREGKIRGLRRQVSFPLMVRRPDGLMETLGNWKADHVYEEPDERGEWQQIYEDVKGNPEDLYIWKKKHFEAQNGKRIREI
jgi:hypothetical protein